MGQNRRIIQIIGFQGSSNRYQEYSNEDPLIIYGHVGIRFEENLNEEEPVIYGFHPSKKTVNTLGFQVFMQRMKTRVPVDGVFHNDYHIFRRVYNLTATRSSELLTNDPLRLKVYVMSFGFAPARYSRMKRRVESWYNTDHKLDYLFAPIFAHDPFDNCATVQRQVNFPVPAFRQHHGYLRDYIKVFKQNGVEWTP